LLRDYAVITPGSAHADLVVLNTEVDKKAQMSKELRSALESDDDEAEDDKSSKDANGASSQKKESRRAGKLDKNVNFFDDVFHIKRTRVLNSLRMLQSPSIIAQLRPNTIDRVLIPFVFAEFVKSVPAEVRARSQQHHTALHRVFNWSH
jgi:hypothetical protein